MNAMILAAGLGTRLGALGAAMPKILIDVGGQSLLSRHVEYLAGLGVGRVVINIHHHADLIERHVSEMSSTVDVICIREPQLLGTAGGVRNALTHLGSDAFLVVYGDVLFPDPIDPMLHEHTDSGWMATLAVHQAESAIGKGVVETDERGRVTRFVEKGAAQDGPALINSGLYVLEPEVVAGLSEGAFADFGDHVFPELLSEGAELGTFKLPQPVIDIGTPKGLEAARALASRPGLQGNRL